jgi:hypothetical protein
MGIAKSKYESHVLPKLDLVEKWTRDGLGTKQIAKNLGIGESTLWEYNARYPEFAEKLAKGREVVDTIVENAFLKRITGYDADEVRREYVYETNEYGETVRVLKKEIVQTKHIPGDPRAAEFWMKNRMPDKYQDRPGPDDSDEDSKGGVIFMPAVKGGDVL